MLRPFLFVGCGGSGVRTIRHVRRKLDQRLRAQGYSGSFPDAWQFLAIDVPNIEDTGGELKQVPGVRYVGLSDPFATYHGANGADRQLASRNTVARSYAEWRPDPVDVHANIVIGAGQQRAVGRVVIGVYGDRLRAVINQATTACTSNNSQLRTMYADLFPGARPTGEVPTPIVILVSSLGGGAGSGIFLDVADMIRMSAEGTDTWMQQNLCAFLYDPSVFSGSGTVIDAGIPPNALAAMSELVAGQWSTWAQPNLVPGFQGELGRYSGPECSFLIGGTNGNVTYNAPDQVYETTAEGLAAWVSNPDLGASLESWAFGNWSTRAFESQIRLHGGPGTRMPLSSFGYSRVGLGRAKFGSYLEERITRESVQRLLTCHHTDDVIEGRMTDAEAARLRAESDGHRLAIEFLRACQLDEHSDPNDHNEDNNQVLDAVRDEENLASESKELSEKVANAVTDRSKIVTQLEIATKDNLNGIPEKYRKRHIERAMRWSEAIQTTVLEETLALIALEGLPVATNVLAEVIRRVGTEFPDQLVAEKRYRLAHESRWERRGTLIAQLKMRGNQISKNARNLLKVLFGDRMHEAIEADLRDIVADLLRDLTTEFLKPLHRRLTDVTTLLRDDQRSEWFRELSDHVPPTRLHPSRNEVVLESVDTYPRTYVDLLGATAGSVPGALSDVIRGNFGSDRSRRGAPDAAQPWVLEPWVPRLARDLDEPRTPTSARIDLRLAGNDIMERAGHWMRCDVQTPIGAHLAQSLRHHLGGEGISEAERRRRSSAFAAALEDGFERATPLVEIAGGWSNSQFGATAGNTVLFQLGKVPLGKGDPGRDQAAEVVARRLDEADVSRYFESGSAGDVEIAATLRPLPPSAFGTLVFPIVQAWAESAARDPRHAGRFWQHRRARPLLESLPLPTHVRLTLARGWLAGLQTGRLEWKDHDGPARIRVGDEWKTFLHPALGGPPAARSSEFSTVLEGVLLAEMMAVAGTREPLEALDALLQLGTAGDRNMVENNYDTLNVSLATALAEREDPAATAREWIAGLESLVAALQVELDSFQPTGDYTSFPKELADAPLYRRAANDVIHALRRRSDDGNQERGEGWR